MESMKATPLPTRAGARSDPRHALGRLGEALAAAHLVKLGFSVLARNARTRHGEIDLIAFDERTLLFAEVKTRRVGAGQRAIRADQEPLARLTKHQRARLRRLAASWLAGAERTVSHAGAIRFDAIGVIVDTENRLRRIDHVMDAF